MSEDSYDPCPAAINRLRALPTGEAITFLLRDVFTGDSDDPELRAFAQEWAEAVPEETRAQWRRMADGLWIVEVVCGNWEVALRQLDVSPEALVFHFLRKMRGIEDPRTEEFLEELPFRMLRAGGERLSALLPWIKKHLRDSRPEKRLFGIRALAALGTPAALSALRGTLGDADPALRRAVRKALLSAERDRRSA